MVCLDGMIADEWCGSQTRGGLLRVWNTIVSQRTMLSDALFSTLSSAVADFSLRRRLAAK